MTDPDTQHALFCEAVELLGGTHQAGARIGVAPRTISRLLAREYRLHDGFLRDIAAALTERAGRCRELERRLSPLFAENYAPDQPRETARGRPPIVREAR